MQQPTVLVAVHSFTPCLDAMPAPRPWELGLLYNRHEQLSHAVRDVLATDAAHLNVAFNEPNCVGDLEDFTIPVHGERRGLANMLLEVRNDHIANEAGEASGSPCWAPR